MKSYASKNEADLFGINPGFCGTILLSGCLKAKIL